MSYSLSAAAKACGVHKSTILRALRRGAISGVRDENGDWILQECEVHRIYPLAATGNGADNHPRTDAQPAEHLVLETELACSRVLVETLREQVRDLIGQRDKWQTVAEQVKLLTDQREQLPKVNIRPWWRRRFGVKRGPLAGALRPQPGT
jgi:hypothetical protein